MRYLGLAPRPPPSCNVREYSTTFCLATHTRIVAFLHTDRQTLTALSAVLIHAKSQTKEIGGGTKKHL